MSENKKYYYMRLKENFFDTDELIYLESLEEGYLFSNILLKLYLRSLKNEGVLMMNEFVPYDARMISRFTNHSLSTVEKALFEFKKLGLIEVLDSGQMYMSNIELFVGKTTTEADRKRLGRMKAEQKLLANNDERQMSDKCPPEIELEKELELELELELDNSTSDEDAVATKKTKEQQLHEDIQTLFKFYMKQNLYNHKKLTDPMVSAVKGRLKDGFTLNELCQAIKNYAVVYHSKDHFFDTKYTFDKIMRRKDVQQFVDEGEPLKSFLTNKQNKNSYQQNNQAPRSTYEDYDKFSI